MGCNYGKEKHKDIVVDSSLSPDCFYKGTKVRGSDGKIRISNGRTRCESNKAYGYCKKSKE